MFVYLSLIVLLIVCIHLLLNYNERARILRKIPGPKESFLFGNALQLLTGPEDLMKMGLKYSLKWKGIFRFWFYPEGSVNVYNPEDVETIMSNVKYNDKSFIYNFLTPWLRNGLLVSNEDDKFHWISKIRWSHFTTDEKTKGFFDEFSNFCHILGEKWQQRRKLLTPAFHFNILRRYYIVLQESTQRLVEQLEKSAGESVNVVPILSEYTLHTICETAMGTQLSGETSQATRTYKQAIYDLGKVLLDRFMRFYLYSDFIFNLSITGSATKNLVKIVQQFTERVIIERREYIDKYGIQLSDDDDDADNIYRNKRKTAMLDLLLLAEKDGHIDTTGIQEEVDTFMFEGHDTTSSALIFCLMSLANDKAVQNKIFSELSEIFGDSNRPAAIEDLSKMKYLECCIKESMRLYPPVHFISRNITEDVQLSGYTVPSGTICNINILCLHRSHHLYKNPSHYDPDRFLPENSVGRHAYAYIPFSAGPRNCIGQKFAMMEMKSALAEILRKFELESVTRHEEIEFTADLVLRHAGPVYVKFVKR